MTWHIEVLAVAFFLKEENGGGVGIILIDCIAPIRLPRLTLDRHLIEDCEEAAGDKLSWHVIESRTIIVNIAGQIVIDCPLEQI